MLALKTSFQSLYEQTKQQGHQVCINCPLHQYHKLCEDITGMRNTCTVDVLTFQTLLLHKKLCRTLLTAIFFTCKNPCIKQAIHLLLMNDFCTLHTLHVRILGRHKN